MCLYPKLIKNRKYQANKKNGGNVPPLPLYEYKPGQYTEDRRVMAVPVGCGKCMECMKKKAREWQVRLLEEVRERKDGKFITFTFSNESIIEITKDIHNKTGYELDNEIATKATRKFLERWRKKNKKSLRHWFVTELGQNGTENIHIHGIVWTNKSNAEITETWKYGHTWIGDYVNEETVNYIVKYMYKTDIKHKEYKPKVLTSAGIGSGYINRLDSKRNKYQAGKTKETYINRQGYKMALPIYYRNKLYTDQEKEKLWIEKIDEGIRYVDGNKVNVKNGNEKYFKLLDEARKKNKELGYGDDTTDWKRKEYEEQRRMYNMEQRTNGGYK